MLFRIARAVRALSLGVWLGGIVMFFIVASSVFAYFVNDFSADRTTAGEIVSLVIKRAMPIKIGFALLAFFSAAVIFFNRSPDAPKGWRKFLPNAMLMLAFVALLVSVLWLNPHLESLRDQIGSFSGQKKDNHHRQSTH